MKKTAFLIGIMVLYLGLGSFVVHTRSAPTNLLINGNLDSWFSSTDCFAWTEDLDGGDSIEQETTVVRSGSSLNYTLPSWVFAPGGGFYQLVSGFSINTNYTLEAWIKTTIGTSVIIEMTLDFEDSMHVSQYFQNPSPSNWIKIHATGNSATSTTAWVSFNVFTEDDGDMVYFDDIAVYSGNLISEFSTELIIFVTGTLSLVGLLFFKKKRNF